MTDLKELEKAIDDITEIAKQFGLDFFPMRYEICPADILYQFGAYGMPTRFHHWSFGKQFYKMKLHYDLGLSQIYELVINSNPCYAFLLDTNTLIQNKLIVAHVLAHSDFFKNNYYFQHTRRDMVDSMAATAERIRFYESRYGKETVESFLDAILAIQEHIDPHVRIMGKQKENNNLENPPLPYADLHPKRKSEEATDKPFPEHPEKDLLLFLQEHSPILHDWQRDILTMIREEMYYFWPQLETKIMNEGWATYWHQRIMRELDLQEDELIEYAKLNAAVVQTSPRSLNPYYLGWKLFEHIEETYNHPAKGQKASPQDQGREKIFEVRKMDNDTSFIRNYLTKDFVEKEDMFVYEKKENVYQITHKDYEAVRSQLLLSRTNGGFPYVVVKDGNYKQNGELYLLHRFEGIELDLDHLEHVLQYLFQLWGKTVHLQTKVKGKKMLYSYNGVKHYQRELFRKNDFYS